MLHEVHCQRNFYHCVCGEFLNKSEREEHESTLHKAQTCEHCRLSAPAYEMAKHKCPKLPKPCTFCNAVIIFDDFIEHVKQCGSRTQLCPICNKYVQTWQFEKHEASCVPVPEPAKPQKPNRFLQQEKKTKAEADPRPAVPERRAKVEEDKKVSAARPIAKRQAQPASAMPKVPVVTPQVAAKPTVPSKATVSARDPVVKPKAGGRGIQTGPRTRESPPVEKKAPDTGIRGSRVSDDDFVYEEVDSPRGPQAFGDEVEDEELARAVELSHEAARQKRAPQPTVSRSKPTHSVEADEELARVMAESMQDAQRAAKPHGQRQEDPADEALQRVIQESMKEASMSWAEDEDPVMNEVILQSLKEK